MTDKKMKIDDLKKVPSKAEKAKAKAKADKAEAIASLKEAKSDAQKALDEMGSEVEIAIQGECLDKYDNKTKVLVIDTDKEGYIGLFLELGNPYSLTQKGEQKEDGSKLTRYINFMSNIDLNDSDNQKAVGFKAISKARSTVANFFSCHLVLALDVDDEMES